MLRLTRLLVALAPLGLLSPTSVSAAATATVEAVQSPAWRDRGGLIVPLAAGMELKSGDVLRTGSGVRVFLKLAEGSRVKLGEAARFTFYSNRLRP